MCRWMSVYVLRVSVQSLSQHDSSACLICTRRSVALSNNARVCRGEGEWHHLIVHLGWDRKIAMRLRASWWLDSTLRVQREWMYSLILYLWRKNQPHGTSCVQNEEDLLSYKITDVYFRCRICDSKWDKYWRFPMAHSIWGGASDASRVILHVVCVFVVAHSHVSNVIVSSPVGIASRLTRCAAWSVRSDKPYVGRLWRQLSRLNSIWCWSFCSVVGYMLLSCNGLVQCWSTDVSLSLGLRYQRCFDSINYKLTIWHDNSGCMIKGWRS